MDSKTRKQHLRAQASSGLTVIEYCTHHNLNRLTFYKWRSEINRKTEYKKTAAINLSRPLFKEVTIPAYHAQTEYRITAAADSSITLTIPSGFDTDEIRTLLRVVTGNGARC